MKNIKPTISMVAFFALPEVRAAQDVQKNHPHGSAPHRAAFDEIRKLAGTYGAASFFEY